MKEKKNYVHNVFLSWTGADRNVKEQIREYFESKQDFSLNCYDSDRDCKGDFVEDFTKALLQSQIYLLILSDSLKNDPNITGKGNFSLAQKELSMALELDAKGELNIIVLNLSEYFKFETPPDVNDKMGVNYYGKTCGLSKVNAIGQTELAEEILEKLYQQSKNFIVRRNMGIPIPSHQPKEIKISKKEIIVDDFFQGRTEELNKIKTAYDSGAQIVVLSGMGGIGKTQIAKAFAIESKKNGYFVCPQIVHIQDFTGANKGIQPIVTAVDYAEEIDKNIGPITEQEKYKIKLDALRSLPEYVLLVIDNYNDLNEFSLNNILTEGLKCKILLTTRATSLNFDKSSVVNISINSIEKNSFFEVFKNYSGLENSEQNREIYSNIYDKVGGHTLTLCLIAKMIPAQRMNPAEILEKMSDLGAFTGDVDFAHNTDVCSRTVLDHLHALFYMGNLNDECKNILLNMSLLSTGKISLSKLKSILSLENYNSINKLINFGWLNIDIERGQEYLFLHPVLSEVVRDELKPNSKSANPIINYLAEISKETRNSSLGDAVSIEDALFFAILHLASSESKLNLTLWDRFIDINHLLANLEDLKQKVEKLLRYLYDENEIKYVELYADLTTIEICPTRIDIYEKYLTQLKLSYDDYKSIAKNLSISFQYIHTDKKNKDLLKEIVVSAIEKAEENNDDISVILLYGFYCILDYNAAKNNVKKYIEHRKKQNLKQNELIVTDCKDDEKKMKKLKGYNGSLIYLDLLNKFFPKSNNLYDLNIQTINLFKKLYTDDEHSVLYYLWMLLKTNILSLLNKIHHLPKNDIFYSFLSQMLNVVDDYNEINAEAIIEMGKTFYDMIYNNNLTFITPVQYMQRLLTLLKQMLPKTSLINITKLVDIREINSDNPTVGDLFNIQFLTYLNTEMGNSDEAIKNAETFLRLVRRMYPAEHYKSIEALLALADTCQMFGKIKEAGQCLLEAYNLIRKNNFSSQKQLSVGIDIMNDVRILSFFPYKNWYEIYEECINICKVSNNEDDESILHVAFLAFALYKRDKKLIFDALAQLENCVLKIKTPSDTSGNNILTYMEIIHEEYFRDNAIKEKAISILNKIKVKFKSKIIKARVNMLLLEIENYDNIYKHDYDKRIICCNKILKIAIKNHFYNKINKYLKVIYAIIFDKNIKNTFSIDIVENKYSINFDDEKFLLDFGVRKSDIKRVVQLVEKLANLQYKEGVNIITDNMVLPCSESDEIKFKYYLTLLNLKDNNLELTKEDLKHIKSVSKVKLKYLMHTLNAMIINAENSQMSETKRRIKRKVKNNSTADNSGATQIGDTTESNTETKDCLNENSGSNSNQNM